MKVWRDLSEFAGGQLARPYVTVGFFDGVHLGHRAMLAELAEMAELGGGNVVVLTFEPPSSGHWQTDALNYTDERLARLAGSDVGGVLLLDFDRVLQGLEAGLFIEKYIVRGLNAAGVCVGYDHRFGRGGKGDFSLVAAMGKKYGYEVRAAAPLAVEGRVISSTFIRRTLKSGDVAKAARLLGYKYEIEGTVVTGDGLGGAELGYPTANLDHRPKLLPRYGVYAVLVYVGGVQVGADGLRTVNDTFVCYADVDFFDGPYGGFANVGTRPTVSDSETVSVEVHLFDYEANIVGKTVRLAFAGFIREEMKFAGLTELKEQLAADEINARKILNGTTGAAYLI
jgi:riboflavin kinase/FMN adenylyltransferase